MPLDPVTAIGGGMLALIIIKEVFSFIKMIVSRNGNHNGKTKIDLHDIKGIVDQIRGDVDEMKSRTKDLWVWHDKEDPEQPGVKAWYTSKKTEEALIKVADALEKLTNLTADMRQDVAELKLAAYTRPVSGKKTRRKSARRKKS